MAVNRFDYSTGDNLTIPAKFNNDGTMTARSIITSIGVFTYRKADGTIQRELRTPEAVFDESFLETVKNMPIYINHQNNPDGTLIKDPIKRTELSVGHTDDAPMGNNVYLSALLTVDRQDGIDAIKKGLRSLSMGYACDLIDTPGVWGGVAYDKIQTNIRGDHLALVSAGRQGDQAIIRMDSEDAELVTDTTIDVVENIEINKGGKMAENMKTVKIDSVDYEAEAPVIVALNSAQTKLDSVSKELEATVASKSQIEAERDSLKERLDVADAKVVELEASRIDEAMVADRVAKRVALLDSAKKAEVEVKLDASDLEIKKAIILKNSPEAKLDGKDEVYINARFDCACEDMEKAIVSAGDASVRTAGAVTTVNNDSVDDKVTVAQKAYKERLANGYKVKKEGN